MPKQPKSAKSAAVSAARASAHPIARASSSKKKKKTTERVGHAASLGEDLEKLANPGKLKPIAAAPAASGSARAGKAAGKEEQKLENQLLLAGKASSAAGRKAAARAAAAADAMEDDDDDDDAGGNDDDDDEDEDEGGDDGALIPARMSKKILQQVHAQQKEEEDGEGVEEEQGGAHSSASRLRQHISLQPGGDDDDEDDDDEDGGDEYELDEASGRSGQHEDALHDEEEEVELSLEDAQALDMFMPSAQSLKGKSLADSILEKMREKEAAASSGASMTHGSNVHFGAGFGSLSSQFGLPSSAAGDAAGAAVRAKLDPKIVDVYQKVGKFLSHYTSGKVPKAFKLVPNLKAWEEILFLTSPESWTAQAHLVATRIFASNLNPRMAQRFYALVLLPKVRADIESHKHLNFHLYQAIKKALYKPAAFFKGLLLPLAEEGATAREAVIMSSILSKCTIPVLHASVAICKLADMPFSGTSALFLKTLLNKKYSLPRRVLRECVQFFCKFLHESPGGLAPGLGACPLIWHQTLLVFVQRYKNELTPNQLTALRNLVRVQQHHAVTAEIRREMLSVDKDAKAAAASTQGAGAFQFGAKHLQAAMAGGAPPQFTSLAASLQNPQSFSMGD